MTGYRDKVGYAQPKDAYIVANKILEALGRRLFDVLEAHYPHASQDAYIGFIGEVKHAHLHDNGVSGDAAFHKAIYEATEAAGIPTVTPSSDAPLTGNIADGITRLIRLAKDMQLMNAVRKPGTDADAAEIRKDFQDAMATMELAYRQHPELDDMEPLLKAVSAIAERKDISAIAEKKFDPVRDGDLPAQKEAWPIAIMFRDNVPPEEIYYDRMALDMVIEANLGRTRA